LTHRPFVAVRSVRTGQRRAGASLHSGPCDAQRRTHHADDPVGSSRSHSGGSARAVDASRPWTYAARDPPSRACAPRHPRPKRCASGHLAKGPGLGKSACPWPRCAEGGHPIAYPITPNTCRSCIKPPKTRSIRRGFRPPIWLHSDSPARTASRRCSVADAPAQPDDPMRGCQRVRRLDTAKDRVSLQANTCTQATVCLQGCSRQASRRLRFELVPGGSAAGRYTGDLWHLLGMSPRSKRW